MKRHPLSRLGTDPRESTELVDQRLDSGRVDAGHGLFVSWTQQVAKVAAAQQTSDIESAHVARSALLLTDLSYRIVERRQDEVLQHLDVVGVDRGWCDGHRLEVEATCDLDLYGAAASLTFVDLRLSLLLGSHELLAHLLRLLEQRIHVQRFAAEGL